ncbi:MAG TPA: hypothetical protein VHU22_25240 [Xanthobacteraceae bacterium]|jgi:hypothetical protein|nr:hypothetical protein [Xanthobacteraceae bacterium]
MTWENSNNGNRRRAYELAAFLGLVGAAIEVPGLALPAAFAQSPPYQAAKEVPSSWRDYAMQLVEKLQQRLASDNDVSGKIADEISGGAAGAAPRTTIVRVWVSPDGKVERLAFDDLSGDVADAMRTLLSDSDVGAPPPDMLQPLHIRLSLAGKPAQEQMH